MTLEEYRQFLFGVTPPASPPGSEPAKQQEWAIREGAPHWAAQSLPAGHEAWTDYRAHDRLLTRQKEHEQAQQVHVVEPLGAGERVRIEKNGSGVYEARREG